MSDVRSRVAVIGTTLLAVLALVGTARLAHGHRDVVPLEGAAAPVALAPAAAPAAAPRARPRSALRTTGRVDPAWAARTAARTGIPATAVAAYGQATLRAARERPGCRLGWTTLAGIGFVESEHGTLDGRTLGPDGRSSTPVLGPALDGDRFAAVRATATSVRWHGDVHWDHAVGPMQFIPSTWDHWSSDGDDDGVADPHDLFDASWAAARYLCADGHDLSTGAGWSAAVLSYNHSSDYLSAVLLAADTYAARL